MGSNHFLRRVAGANNCVIGNHFSYDVVRLCHAVGPDARACAASDGVGGSGPVVYLGGQPVYPIERGVEVLDGLPQGRVLFPNLLEGGARGGERREIETHVCARPCHRCPQGTERDDDIGDKRRVTVGSKPPQISDGIDGSLAEHGRCLGGDDGCPVYGVLAFRPQFQPKRGAESFRG